MCMHCLLQNMQHMHTNMMCFFLSLSLSLVYNRNNSNTNNIYNWYKQIQLNLLRAEFVLCCIVESLLFCIVLSCAVLYCTVCRYLHCNFNTSPLTHYHDTSNGICCCWLAAAVTNVVHTDGWWYEITDNTCCLLNNMHTWIVKLSVCIYESHRSLVDIGLLDLSL